MNATSSPPAQTEKGLAVQDCYSDDVSHCFGCGRLNDHGHHIRTFWDGDETVSRFMPEPYHMAAPGFVYGGILASLVDCHGTGTAAAAAYRAAGRAMGTEPALRYVTASLEVDYLRPTPLGVMLEARGHVLDMKGRRIRTEVRVLANGVECVRGVVAAVLMPEAMSPGQPPIQPDGGDARY
jgi:acyl-coenzyme A thioesterase PaaI-like protein